MLDPKRGMLCDACEKHTTILYPQPDGRMLGACCVPRPEGGCFFCGELPAPHDYHGEPICQACYERETEEVRWQARKRELAEGAFWDVGRGY